VKEIVWCSFSLARTAEKVRPKTVATENCRIDILFSHSVELGYVSDCFDGLQNMIFPTSY